MYVHVTQEDIDKNNHSAMGCPVALAVSRTVGSPAYATRHIPKWNRWVIGLRRGPNAFKDFLLSPKTGQRIANYDAGKGMRPFRFKLPKGFPVE